MSSYKSTAVVHGSRWNPVYLKEFDISAPGPREVVIKTAYASINPVDIKLHAITLRNGVNHTLADYSGTVAAFGSEVKGLEVGDRVWGQIFRPTKDRYVGSYTIANVDCDVVAPLPTSLSLEQAGSLGIAYGTAYQMLERAANLKKIGPDSRILVFGGATSVGSHLIQLAKKHFNAGHVVATASPASKEYVEGFGADTVINYRVPDLSAELVRYVKTTDKKFDAILDTVGGYDGIAVYPEILKPSSEGSSYITIMGDTPPSNDYVTTITNALLSIPRVGFRILFGKYYGINYSLLMHSKGPWIEAAHEVFGTPGTKVPIDSVYPVDEIKEAWAKVDSTRARGKVLIRF